MDSDLANDDSWILRLTEGELKEIDAALRTFRRRNRKLADMTKEDFPLPGFSARLDECLDEIRNGRGFILLRGLPVQGYSDEDAGAIFYGMGLYLGNPLLQNPQGDLLGHVRDQGRKFGELNVRGYQSNAYLPFHTDGCEMVGLLCLRPAKAGGLSSIASSVAIYHEIKRTHPEFLEPLKKGYHYIRREAAFSESPISLQPIPLFDEADGVVSCRFNPTQIEAALASTAKPLDDLQRRALDEVVKLSADERFRLDMNLQQGDIQLINNYLILHSRTEYEDWPEPERKRHMLRLWLGFRDGWPLAPGFKRQLGYVRENHSDMLIPH